MKQEGKRHGGKREAAMPAWMMQVKGTVIGVLTAILLLGLCSVLVAAAIVPEQGMNGCVLACCAIGALFGAMIGVKEAGRRRLLGGICTGAAMAVVLGGAGFLLYSGPDIVWGSTIALVCVLGGAAAGVFGNRRGRRRRG